MLDFRVTYELFGRWDVKYAFDRRPKSDAVMRTLARSQIKCTEMQVVRLGYEAFGSMGIQAIDTDGAGKTGQDGT